MILEPDFLDHWKTQTFIRLLGEPVAPLYLLALWFHCQRRKVDRLAVSPAELAAICRYPGDPERLTQALKACRFVDEIQCAIPPHKSCTGFLIHDFAVTNGKLFANWKNGVKGGRRKKPKPKLEEPTPSNLILSNHISSSTSTGTGTGTKAKPKDRQEVLDFVREQGLPETDGHYCFDHWESNGFTNGGKAIKDWKATIRAWSQQPHILPSRKKLVGPSQFKKQTDPNQQRRDEEYEQHRKQMAALKGKL